MQKKLSIKVLPSEAEDAGKLTELLAQACTVKPSQITGYTVLKKSIDARSRKQVWVQLTANVFIDEPVQQEEPTQLRLQDVHNAKRSVIVIGAGPAGRAARGHYLGPSGLVLYYLIKLLTIKELCK